jgi:hypothetical protein
MNGEFILVGVIFILILFVSTYGSSRDFVPYSFSSSRLPLYPYEGFSGDRFLNPARTDPAKRSNPSLDLPRSEELSGAVLSKCSPVMDKVSKLPGKPECIGNSAGLSNSRGGICLDADTIRQIKTRGRNFA